MERITIGMIEKRVDYLNKITGQPEKPWGLLDGVKGSMIGNYHTYGAYGMTGILQMVSNRSGAVRIVVSLGTKRETFEKLNAYIDGYQAQKEGKEI